MLDSISAELILPLVMQNQIQQPSQVHAKAHFNDYFLELECICTVVSQVSTQVLFLAVCVISAHSWLRAHITFCMVVQIVSAQVVRIRMKTSFC